MQKKYDALDRQATEIMLKAETNCAATFSHPAPWSVALMRASTAIKYWSLRISQFSGGKTSASTMKAILHTAHMVDVTETEEQARTERTIAWKSLAKCCLEAEEIREKELQSRAEDSSALGDGKATITYENLIEHKKYRSQWRKIKFFLK